MRPNENAAGKCEFEAGFPTLTLKVKRPAGISFIETQTKSSAEVDFKDGVKVYSCKIREVKEPAEVIGPQCKIP